MSARQEQPPSSIEPDESSQEQEHNPVVRNAAMHLLRNEPEWVLRRSGMDRLVRNVLGDSIYDDYQAQRRELDQRLS